MQVKEYLEAGYKGLCEYVYFFFQAVLAPADGASPPVVVAYVAFISLIFVLGMIEVFCYFVPFCSGGLK